MSSSRFAAIAKGDVIRSAFAAFRFALVGFALPFAFVFRPELLMLTADNQPAAALPVLMHVTVTLVGILGLSAAMTGFAFGRMAWSIRGPLLLASLTIFFTRWEGQQFQAQMIAVVVVLLLMAWNFVKRQPDEGVDAGASRDQDAPEKEEP